MLRDGFLLLMIRYKEVLFMKKMYALLLITVMLLTLFACSSKEPVVVKTYEVTDSKLVEEYIKERKLVTLVEYYEMSDGTWKCEDYTYKYRLEFSEHESIKPSTGYVYLSNIKNITYEQAMRASGLSSLSDDYFKVEDAILVAIQ